MSKEPKPNLLQLDASRKEVRLLKIMPRCFKPGREEELFCEIHRRKLANIIDRYAALSYSWGKDISPQPIFIVRKHRVSEWIVQESLYQALCHIRRENESVNLWVDAICINQKDKKEKTAQVQQMRPVYEMAKVVVVWLGPAADDSDTVISGMKKAVAEFKTNNHRGSFLPAGGLIGGLVSIDGLSKLLARSWWTRVWVIQEIKVAKNVQFLCGREYIGKDILSTFLGNIYKLRRTSFTLPNWSDNSERLQLAGKDPRPRLLLSHLIWNTQQHERQLSLLRWLSDVCARHPEDSSQRMGATYPQDYIWGLLGLCKISESRDELKWEYDMGCNEIYLKAAVLMLKDNRMAVLSYAQMPKQITGLPSWVPDWSSPISLPLTMWSVAGSYNFCASGAECGRSGLLKVTDTGTCLALSCRLLDSVHSVREVKMDYNDIGALYKYVRTVAHMMDGKINPYERKEKIKISALRNITCDLEMPSNRSMPDIQRLRKEVVENVWDILKTASWHKKRGTPSRRANWFEEEIRGDNKKAVLRFLQTLCDLSDDKYPFITCNGWLGMGPRYLQKGDFVAIVSGADMPYLIRHDEGHYRLVGEAYVHGFMDGQILKMGIPESEIDLY